jgi:hypothetical protein
VLSGDPAAAPLDVTARFHLNINLDIPAEPDQHRNQPLQREPLQLGLPHARKIGCRKSGQLMRAPHGNPAIVQDADNSRRENSLGLKNIGIRMAEVAEHVAASTHNFDGVLFHCKTSFSRFNRSLIRSTSICGVLIPLFDFFWKASITQMSSPICTA